MTNNTIIPHDHHHHHRLHPHHHHQEMDQLQALAVKKPAQAAKRQARRRTHTSRPYQERLLNMAEARREIVTALKIHRATSSTRHPHQQSTHHHHHHHHHEPPPPLHRKPPQFSAQLQQQQEEASLPHTTAAMSAAAAAASFADPLRNYSPPAHSWIAAGRSYWSPVPILHLPCEPEHELPPTGAMGGLEELEQYQYQYQGGLELERLVRSLPAQPLGLNLNFQGFGVSVDDDGARASKDDDDCEHLLAGLPPSTTQPSPPAVETTATADAYGGHGYGSPELSAATDAEKSNSVIDAPAAAAALVPAVLLDGGGEMTIAQASAGSGVMQMQGVAECWSEAASADVAAWWSKIFGSVESGGQQHQQNAHRPNAEDDNLAAAEPGLPAAAAEPGLPAAAAEWRWRLCGGGDDVGVVGEQQQQGADVVLGTTTVMHHVDNDGEHEDVNLPCMDGIGDDTEGWDGEWFSSCS